MSATEYHVNSFKDFEIIWIDFNTHLPKDMQDVSFEIYHYQAAKAGKIIVPVKEPYILKQGLTDTLLIGIGQCCECLEEIIVDLNLAATDLSSLGCPGNNYVVCGTNQKSAIVNGYLTVALSACELASLINHEGPEYFTASEQGGFLVLTGTLTGADTYLKVSYGTINGDLGLVPGTVYPGDDLRQVYDIVASPMVRMSTGQYVYPNVLLSQPPYSVEERYFAVYRGFDPVLLRPELLQENFTVILNKSEEFTYSFTG